MLMGALLDTKSVIVNFIVTVALAYHIDVLHNVITYSVDALDTGDLTFKVRVSSRGDEDDITCKFGGNLHSSTSIAHIPPYEILSCLAFMRLYRTRPVSVQDVNVSRHRSLAMARTTCSDASGHRRAEDTAD